MTKRKARTNGPPAAKLDEDFIVEMWDVNRPKPYEADPMVHTQESIEKLADIVRRVGPQVAIVVDEDGVIAKGRRTWAAYKLLGMKRVPVKVARGVPDAEILAWRLADNRAGRDDGWDEGVLGVELKKLEERGVPLSHSAFEEAELDRLLGSGEPGELAPISVRPLPTMTWVLLGIPTVRFPEIAELVSAAQMLDDVVCDITANDKSGK